MLVLQNSTGLDNWRRTGTSQIDSCHLPPSTVDDLFAKRLHNAISEEVCVDIGDSGLYLSSYSLYDPLVAMTQARNRCAGGGIKDSASIFGAIKVLRHRSIEDKGWSLEVLDND